MPIPKFTMEEVDAELFQIIQEAESTQTSTPGRPPALLEKLMAKAKGTVE